MKYLLNRVPDLAAVIILFGPARLWAYLNGTILPDSFWIYMLLLLIWMRLMKMDWGLEERSRSRSS